MLAPFVTEGGFVRDLTRLTDGDVLMDEISASLAKQCMFGGHSQVFYSRAQFALLVASLMRPGLRLHALLYEASYAFTGAVEPHLIDALTAFGMTTDAFDRLQNSARKALFEAVDIRFPLAASIEDEIRAARRMAIATIRRDLLPETHRHLVNPYFGFPVSTLRRQVALPWPTAQQNYYAELMSEIGRSRRFEVSEQAVAV